MDVPCTHCSSPPQPAQSSLMLQSFAQVPLLSSTLPAGQPAAAAQVRLVLSPFSLQHWVFLVQCLPLRLQQGGSADASPMPSDPSVPPTTAAPINLSALPRVMEPSASPLARSSKKPSSLAIGSPLPQ